MVYFGLPVTNEINPELISFIKSTNKIVLFDTDGVSSWDECKKYGDYKQAETGYDLLIQSGFVFVNPNEFDPSLQKIIISKSVWYDDNKVRRTPSSVAKIMLQLKDNFLHKDYVPAFFSIGSPLVGDGIYNSLISTGAITKTINTKSSPELIHDLFDNINELNIIDKEINYVCEHGFLPKSFNVLISISAAYQKQLIVNWVEFLLSHINESDSMFFIHIGKDNSSTIIKQISKEQFPKIIEDPFYLNGFSFVVIKK